MPDRESHQGRGSRLPRAFVWIGVTLAPAAAAAAVLGGGGRSLRLAVVLVAVCLVLIGAAVLVRHDPVLLKMDVEDRVAAEMDALRAELYDEVAAAARTTHHRVQAVQEEIGRLRGQPPGQVAARPELGLTMGGRAAVRPEPGPIRREPGLTTGRRPVPREPGPATGGRVSIPPETGPVRPERGPATGSRAAVPPAPVPGSPAARPAGAPPARPASAPAARAAGGRGASPAGSPVARPSDSPVGRPPGSPVARPAGSPVARRADSPVGRPSGAPVSGSAGPAEVPRQRRRGAAAVPPPAIAPVSRPPAVAPPRAPRSTDAPRDPYAALRELNDGFEDDGHDDWSEPGHGYEEPGGRRRSHATAEDVGYRGRRARHADEEVDDGRRGNPDEWDQQTRW